METQERLLRNYTDAEKGAYIGAIASLATADHAATEEELEYIAELADSADISDSQKKAVIRAATQLSEEELRRCLDILKSSDLRFSLVADLIAFSESDKKYSDEEKKAVENIAQYLGISSEQFSLLDQFVKKSSTVEPQPPELEKQGFLAALGLEDKFQNAGINWKGFMKGLLGVAGPAMLANMFLNRRNSSGGGSLLNTGGGLLNKSRGNGIGSLISTLSGGKGFGNIGGLLSKLLGTRN